VLRRAALGGLALSGGGVLLDVVNRSDAFAAATAAVVKHGGTMRVGVGGGSTSDTLDAHNPLVDTDIARVFQLYEPLVARDKNYALQNVLAESVEPGRDAKHWTVRLRRGLLFSNGRAVTADDVIFSLKRIVDPKNPKRGAAELDELVKGRMEKVDSRTVSLTLSRPNSEFPSALAEYYNGIVPADYDPKKPIGTGPFALKSFTPGRQSVMVRNPHYWRSGQPYLDQVVIVDIADDAARINALVSGQVEAIQGVPFNLVPQVEGSSKTKLLRGLTGNWTPLIMRTDVAPFNDARVRQAFRLIVDRNQMAKTVFAGHAEPANDVFGRWDPSYNHALKQREQDIDQAKSLLRKAGHSGLSVELTTGDLTTGTLAMAQVFQQQAKAAGVSVTLRTLDPGTFYGKGWLSYPFTQDYWYTRSYLGQVAQVTLKSASSNETHFANARYESLYRQARAQLKPGLRAEIIHAMQSLDWTLGGYIIPTFNDQLDAYSTKMAGFSPSRNGGPLGDYTFRNVSFR
jgi:peptide/nickel transport system substrate-binding protein